MNATDSPTLPRGDRISAALRLTATPLTMVTFLVCGATGLALFFDWHGRVLDAVHEWSGVAMLVAVALHLARHWRPAAQQFKRWPLWVAFGGAAIAAVAVTAFQPTGGGREHRGEGQRHGGHAGQHRAWQADDD